MLGNGCHDKMTIPCTGLQFHGISRSAGMQIQPLGLDYRGFAPEPKGVHLVELFRM